MRKGQVSCLTYTSGYLYDPGWVVIHADENGAPGPAIGRAAVSNGENTDVMVEIDTKAATVTLHAMLHTDTGEMGIYEFLDADPPVRVDGSVVVNTFETMVMLSQIGAASMRWTGGFVLTGVIMVSTIGILIIRLCAMRGVRIKRERSERRR